MCFLTILFISVQESGVFKSINNRSLLGIMESEGKSKCEKRFYLGFTMVALIVAIGFAVSNFIKLNNMEEWDFKSEAEYNEFVVIMI